MQHIAQIVAGGLIGLAAFYFGYRMFDAQSTVFDVTI